MFFFSFFIPLFYIQHPWKERGQLILFSFLFFISILLRINLFIPSHFFKLSRFYWWNFKYKSMQPINSYNQTDQQGFEDKTKFLLLREYFLIFIFILFKGSFCCIIKVRNGIRFCCYFSIWIYDEVASIFTLLLLQFLSVNWEIQAYFHLKIIILF